jgi:uncharacterized protein DUF3592
MNGHTVGQFAVLILVIAGALLLRHFKRSRRGRHWIPVMGTVSTYRTGTNCSDDNPTQFFAAVTYTYTVENNMYWGEFQETVKDEQAAQRVFDRFPKGSPIALLRDPKRPQLSCRLPQK